MHYRLDQLKERHDYDERCGKNYSCLWCQFLYLGPKAETNPAYKGAFNKGVSAWQAGDNPYTNPYRDSRRDRYNRKGHRDSGFAASFVIAWDVGWAWAQFNDEAESVLRALSDFEKRSMPTWMGTER